MAKHGKQQSTDRRIPKVLLATGKKGMRETSFFFLKDVNKSDMRAMDMGIDRWEDGANDLLRWTRDLWPEEKKRGLTHVMKRGRSKENITAKPG